MYDNEDCINQNEVMEDVPQKELLMTDPSEMSDEVKDAVIRHFQKSAHVYQQQYEHMSRNAQSSYQQARALEEEYHKLERESKAKIQLLKQNISTIYQNSLIV